MDQQTDTHSKSSVKIAYHLVNEYILSRTLIYIYNNMDTVVYMPFSKEEMMYSDLLYSAGFFGKKQNEINTGIFLYQATPTLKGLWMVKILTSTPLLMFKTSDMLKQMVKKAPAPQSLIDISIRDNSIADALFKDYYDAAVK